MCYSFISVYANLPNFSFHFWKHEPVFLQILHQSPVPSNITPLYFFSSNINFGQRSQLKSSFLDFQVLESKFLKFLMSILKWQANSSSNFTLFFIVMTHNTSVNFKVIHFLLWTKRSHPTPNFDTFKCSGKNLWNFSNHKSVFLQILHHSSVSWKITPLYFFRSNIKYFAQ